MPFLLLVLIVAGVGGLAVAAYLMLVELSRRQVMGRAMGTSAGVVSQRILRTPTRSLEDTFGGRILKRAPSVWAQNASIKHDLVQAGFDGTSAPMVYASARVISLVLFPLVALLIYPGSTFTQNMVILASAALAGLMFPVWYLHRSIRLRQERIRRALPDALDLL